MFDRNEIGDRGFGGKEASVVPPSDKIRVDLVARAGIAITR